MKMIKLSFSSLLISVWLSISVFAGTWQSGENGWTYQNDDGSYLVNCWQWLDGNGDGIAESYYFDSSGRCLTDTVTPDGYTVDANGAWVVDGNVQQKFLTAPASSIPTSDSQTIMESAASASSKAQNFSENAAASSSTERNSNSNAAFISSAAQSSGSSAVSVSHTVWLSRTGSKYHSKASCSNMKNPIRSTLEDAVAAGRTPCSKCY